MRCGYAEPATVSGHDDQIPQLQVTALAVLLNPESRNLVPFTSFCEYAENTQVVRWIGAPEDLPPALLTGTMLDWAKGSTIQMAAVFCINRWRYH